MTLNIQNLGRIAQAKIDVKPLTLFIGKNDSGKTYCASSLWSFIKFIAGQDYESALKNLSPQKS
ncbi:AAA family ATPase [Delftia lacustris]|uniref:AAA family ATPase n=1 Tax=Delftia lacustris TaxID=558537 RepID=UPI00193B0811|nr:AAA family ATPase [Delftia lacustris]QRI92528.1 AAA family ATPase [Delftia lacustris]